jgi:tight adherence protein B
MPILIAIAVFVTVSALLLWPQLREQERSIIGSDRIARAMGLGLPANGGADPSVGLRGRRISNSASLAQLLAPLSLTFSIEKQLSRSDWKGMKVSDYLMITGVAAVIPAVIAGRILDSLIAAAIAGIVGAFIPRFLLNRSIKKRRDRFNHQMVDVLSQMANSLKAGFGLLQAMSQAADESKPPLSDEFRQTLHDIQVGAAVDDAFRSLDERVGSEDLGIVVTAILIQRGAGGSLAEIIEGVALTMRERIRIRGEINTLTTQGKYTGYLIGALPILLAAGFFFLNRPYESLLFTTDLGHMLLIGWGVMQVIGLLVIRKILNIEL